MLLLCRAANYFKSTNPELSEKAEAAANKLAQVSEPWQGGNVQNNTHDKTWFAGGQQA
jgi:hypothetical protein